MRVTDHAKQRLIQGYNDPRDGGRPVEFVEVLRAPAYPGDPGVTRTRIHFDRVVLVRGIAGSMRLEFYWQDHVVVKSDWLPEATDASVPMSGSFDVTLA